MTSVHEDAATAWPVVTTRTVDAAEAICFARDLGGSLSHVLVAAAGRALAVDPTRRRRTVGAIGIVVASTSRVGVAIVPGASTDTLPVVRAQVDEALSERTLMDGSCEPPSLVVVEADELGSLRLNPTPARVLEATAHDGDPLVLSLTLRDHGAGAVPEEAERLLTAIARLVERPYRRLV